MESGKFIINEKKKVVVYSLTSKGQEFVACAKCGDADEFDVERGKAIAGRRVDLAIRKRDIEQVRAVRAKIAKIMRSEARRGNGPKAQCKLWMIYYNDAVRVENKHLAHIKLLKKELQDLYEGTFVPHQYDYLVNGETETKIN